MIKEATDDLESHLQRIDEKLQDIFGRTVTESDSDAAELRLIKDERMSTQRCLQICAQLSEHIDQIQVKSPHSDSSSGHAEPETVSERLTSAGLQECKDSLLKTTAKLEGYMKDVIDRLVSKSQTAMSSEEEHADLLRLREEWETARQCMEICSKAETHLKENIHVSTIDNYATGDAVQFMVSTNGKTIIGKNRGVGWRTRQVGGHLSDDALKQVSRDMLSVHLHMPRKDAAPPSREETSPSPGERTEEIPNSQFGERYGPGFKLTSKTTGSVHSQPSR